MKPFDPTSRRSAGKILTGLLLLFLAEAARSQEQCPETRQWTQLGLVPAPVGRQKHTMAYDSARAQTVLFGGSDVMTIRGTNELYGDTWEFSDNSWQQKFPASSPSARFGHTMTYDTVRGVTVLFGGRGDGSEPGKGANDEVWEWNGSDWSRITIVGASPVARAYHGMAYDSARGVHVLYGGTTGAELLSDTWEYDGAERTWTLRPPEGAGPGPRIWFHLAFDAARNKTLLFGGASDSTVQFDDTWTWNGQAGVWTQLNPPAHPGKRQLYGVAYDSQREVVFLQCGSRVEGGSTFTMAEGWEWNGVTWIDQSETYDYCCPRTGAGMVYDSRRQQMVLFGGDGGLEQAVWVLRTSWDGSYSYVDWQNAGTQNGTAAKPFQTLRQAATAASPCSFISILTGDYPEGAITLNKPLRLEARNGSVRIH